MTEKLPTKKAPANEKAAVKKIAKKKTGAKRKTATEKTASGKPITIVVAKIDVGYGNHLFMRGDGHGLSWDRGILMTNTASDEWMLLAEGIEEDFECKVLLNDAAWSKGENIRIKAGKKSVILPEF